MNEQSQLGYRPTNQTSFLARAGTAGAGLWLLASAFLWPHSGPSFTNTWIVGVAIFLASLWSFRDSFARWITGGLAIWLAMFTLYTWHLSAVTLWNNVVVAVCVLGLSAIKS